MTCFERAKLSINHFFRFCQELVSDRIRGYNTKRHNTSKEEKIALKYLI